jgi:hypothetical protein
MGYMRKPAKESTTRVQRACHTPPWPLPASNRQSQGQRARVRSRPKLLTASNPVASGSDFPKRCEKGLVGVVMSACKTVYKQRLRQEHRIRRSLAHDQHPEL